MSRAATSFVLGYHGCSREIGMRAIESGLALRPSQRDFDWLGPGVYFWEGDPKRAREWAEEKVERKIYKNAFVVGAVIDLGNCLDLLVRENLDLLNLAYNSLKQMSRDAGYPMPKNLDARSSLKGDKLLRFRDCAVIKHLHSIVEDGDEDVVTDPFDTVRGLFVEGERAYPGGGFFSKTHTQIAVRNDASIRGYFVPR